MWPWVAWWWWRGAVRVAWLLTLGTSLLLLLVVLVTNEVDLWLGWRSWTRGTNFQIGGWVEFLYQHVNNIPLLVLFREDDFGLCRGRLRWGLNKDDVYMLIVLAWNSDNSGLLIFWATIFLKNKQR